MGGIGSVLSALTATQQASGINVSVILPGYSFLLDRHRMRDLQEVDTITVEVETRPSLLPFQVLDPWDPIGAVRQLLFRSGEGKKAHVATKVTKYSQKGVTVYLIGPGDIVPFTEAFRASDRTDIYSFSPTLPGNHRDIFFCTAVALFLASEHKRDPISYVHLHGATNALLVPFMRGLPAPPHPGATPQGSSLVYTLHDYEDETRYQVGRDILERFTPFPFENDPVTYPVMGQGVYPSTFGIRDADIVTCVSRTMATSILAGELEYTNRPLTIEDIVDVASERRFFGIGNGVDLDLLNPFHHPGLKAAGLHFRPGSSVVEQKLNAKAYLVKKGVIPMIYQHLRIALYVGRFQKGKGMVKCEAAAPEFGRRGALLILMGQANDYDMSALRARKDVLIIDDFRQQEEFGVFLRLAADLVFVPSQIEAFGLVAVEGLLFGCPVVTSAVGGLRDFLIDRNEAPPGTPHNAYFFKYQDLASLRRAIDEVCDYLDLLAQTPPGREELSQKLITTAQGMSWGRSGGPAEQYRAVYHLAKMTSINRRGSLRNREVNPVNIL